MANIWENSSLCNGRFLNKFYSRDCRIFYSSDHKRYDICTRNAAINLIIINQRINTYPIWSLILKKREVIEATTTQSRMGDTKKNKCTCSFHFIS